MKRKWLSKMLAFMLVIGMILPLTACNGTVKRADDTKAQQDTKIETDELTRDIKQDPQVSTVSLEGEQLKTTQTAITNFSVSLFQKSIEKDKNVLISPLSVLTALSMTANGAKGETLEQMESVFGMDMDTLNVYLKDYVENLPQGKAYKLQLANSIWFRDSDGFSVKDEFLQTNANYYDAEIYKSPFDDSTVKEINAWVDKNTDGMIKKILNKITSDNVMFLINALAFDAKWETPYEEYQVQDAAFTTEEGKQQEIEMMYSEEDYYIEDEKATGFIKKYKDGKYAFVGLLPNEGVSVAEYVEGLTGEGIGRMLANKEETMVDVALPKFTTEYEISLNQALTNMGMEAAFDGAVADFSGIGQSGNGNLYIEKVLHKTFIDVSPEGTKAAAVTSVEMNCEGAMIPEYRVYLDRPFVYMLIDCETNLPFFIGTQMSME